MHFDFQSYRTFWHFEFWCYYYIVISIIQHCQGRFHIKRRHFDSYQSSSGAVIWIVDCDSFSGFTTYITSRTVWTLCYYRINQSNYEKNMCLLLYKTLSGFCTIICQWFVSIFVCEAAATLKICKHDFYRCKNLIQEPFIVNCTLIYLDKSLTHRKFIICR